MRSSPLIALFLLRLAAGQTAPWDATLLAAGQTAPWDATLHLHDPATAAQFNAKCLDGSRGGFYFRGASSPSAATKWKFHFQGGGWCFKDNDCVGRSKTLLGSSSFWTPTLSALWAPEGAGFYGLMAANDTSLNPFGDWNFVWLAYCDGSSQTSDRTDPVVVGNATLHYRGRALLDAHLFELERLHGFLSTASEVIISGTSAGGMSTYMHSSFIRTQLRAPGARLVAVPDAGFWWDVPRFGGGGSIWVDNMRVATPSSAWNATLRGNLGACLRAPPGGNALLCYTQPNAYAYLDVPTFVVQSMVDPANFGICWGLPCSLKGNTAGSCNAGELAAIQSFSAWMVGNITQAQSAFGARDGHFITSCNQHEETCRQFDWWGISINGRTMNSCVRLPAPSALAPPPARCVLTCATPAPSSGRFTLGTTTYPARTQPSWTGRGPLMQRAATARARMALAGKQLMFEEKNVSPPPPPLIFLKPLAARPPRAYAFRPT